MCHTNITILHIPPKIEPYWNIYQLREGYLSLFPNVFKSFTLHHSRLSRTTPLQLGTLEYSTILLNKNCKFQILLLFRNGEQWLFSQAPFPPPCFHIHSSVDGHLGWFYILRQWPHCLQIYTQTWDARSHGSSLDYFLSNFRTVFHSGYANLHFHQEYARVLFPLFMTAIPPFVTASHTITCEVMSHWFWICISPVISIF